jgi:hypothetical protein
LQIQKYPKARRRDFGSIPSSPRRRRSKKIRVRFVFREQAKGTPSPFAFQNKKKAALSL